MNRHCKFGKECHYSHADKAIEAERKRLGITSDPKAAGTKPQAKTKAGGAVPAGAILATSVASLADGAGSVRTTVERRFQTPAVLKAMKAAAYTVAMATPGLLQKATVGRY